MIIEKKLKNYESVRVKLASYAEKLKQQNASKEIIITTCKFIKKLSNIFEVKEKRNMVDTQISKNIENMNELKEKIEDTKARNSILCFLS